MKYNENYDIIIRYVPSFGYMARIEEEGTEIYRGRFSSSSHETFERALITLERLILKKEVE